MAFFNITGCKTDLCFLLVYNLGAWFFCNEQKYHQEGLFFSLRWIWLEAKRWMGNCQ